MRRLASASAVALSVVNQVEQGTSWPRLATVQAMAGALGARVTIGGLVDPGIAIATAAKAQRRHLAHLADRAGVNQNTLYALVQHETASPSMATVLASALVLGLLVELEPIAPDLTAGTLCRAG